MNQFNFMFLLILERKKLMKILWNLFMIIILIVFNLQREMDKQFEEQKKVGVFFYRFINGESGADVHARMSIFLQYLFRRILSIDYHSFDNIVIVSHELTIKFFMMNFMNLPVTELDNIKRIDNAQFWTLEKNEYGKYILKDDIFINKKE